MTKEQKFYNILQDLFVGAKLEGDSGYVNLMNIKTDYFNLIKKKIESEIKSKFGDGKPEDLYDKLYTFFDSYFSDGGAIFFSSTPSYKNIYAKVYSDREDVSLFWKTAKLYYVKSEANYRTIENMQLNSDPEIAFDFHFDASLLKHKQANEKKELQFYFIGTQKRASKKVIKFRVIYKNDNKYDKLKAILNIADNAKIIKYILENSEKLNKKILFKNDGLDLKILSEKSLRDLAKAELLIQDNQDLLGGVTVEPAISDTSDIEKYLRLKSIILNSEDIEKAFKVYKKQTEIDYFIHKDAKGFLREQFDLYMYQHLAGNMETIFEQRDLDRIKKIKEIAYLAIDYIGNFEDELKKIWLKPKFARKSNYVVTLDRLADKTNGFKVIDKIIKHKGIKEQVAEWRELNIVKEDFNQKIIIKDGRLNKDFQTLPVDTKYFKDLEIEIIGLFDNLDEALDGRLIKSDNFQALVTLLPKYKEKVQTIYIDPPFNLGENADFDYLVNYKDSTWATLLENRIKIAYDFLKDSGSIFVRCDYNGNYIVRMILDQIFGKDNFKNELTISRIKKSDDQAKKYNTAVDSLFWYTKGSNPFMSIQSFYSEKGERWHAMDSQGQGPALLIFGELREPPRGRHWTFGQSTIKKMEEENRIKLGRNGSVLYLIAASDSQIHDSNWTDIPGYSSITGFSTENAEILLQRAIQTSSKEGDMVLDFFIGGATTQAVAQKLNRKWIGVEIGEQFEQFNKPRIKKVIFGEQVGISKELVAEYSGGGFFKYYELEQYEDALKKAVYNPNEKELENIDFSLSEKQAKIALNVDLKKEKAHFAFEKLYPDVDISETISNLLGKKIKKITKDKVIFEDDYEVDLNNLDFEKNKSLKKLIYW
ncbi:MAG: site-specific DNA-methyltransferase [Candidatus Paceibacterota bacterium]